MDFKTGNLKTINAPEEIPHQLIILPQEEVGYALYPNSHDIVCLNFNAGTFFNWLSLEEVPSHIVFSQLANQFFIAFENSSKIVKVDLDTSTVSSFISLDESIQSLEISIDENLLYAFLKDSNRFEMIDISSLQSKKSLYAYPNRSKNKQNFTNKLAILDKRKSLLIAEEEGLEILNFDLKENTLQKTIQFEHPISSIQFAPEPKPIASFTVEGLTAGESTFFNASETEFDKQGRILYQWDFGDGQTALSENRLIEYSYASPGNYNVILTLKQKTTEHQDEEVFSDQSLSFTEVGKSNLNVSIKPLSSQQMSRKKDGNTAVSKIKRINLKEKWAPFKAQITTPTTTTLSSSLNSSNYGQTITLTATINPLSGPTGTVSFFDGSTLLGSQPVSNSQATLFVSNLSVGSHSLTATYSGDNAYASSTSDPFTQVVIKATPSVTIATSSNPSIYGDLVTFTSTVTAPYSGVPSGTIQFYDNGSPIGTLQTLTQSSSISATASYSLNTLSAGNHAITATYNGNTNFNSALGSLAQNQQVDPTNTSTTIVPLSQSPIQYGQPFNLQAIVVGVPTSPASSPGGTVTFYACTAPNTCQVIGTSSLTSLTNTNTSSANLSFTGFLDVGDYTFYARYEGDSNYNSSTSSNISYTVVFTPTTSSTQVIDNCNGTWSNVTLTTTVTSNYPGSGTPAGNVIFYDGFDLLGTVALDSLGQAILTTPLSVGKHVISAIYQGNSNYTTSFSPTVIVNTTLDTTTTSLVLSSGNNQSNFGNTLTFTARVTKGCSGDANTPTGTVTFRAGSTVLGAKSIDNTGIANIDICNLYPANYSITATYSGDSHFSGSTSNALNQSITGVLDTFTTIIASTENPVAVCPDTTVFTAQVTIDSSICSNLIVNGGTINFYNGKDVIGTANVINGIAHSPPVCFSEIGSQSITAQYTPAEAPFIGSVSEVFSQCVTPYDTETILTITIDGQGSSSATLTATVIALGSGPFPDFSQDGSVSFYSGVTLLQTVSVPPNSNTSFTVSLPVDCIGCTTVKAVYSGENCSNFDTSQDIASIDLIDTQTTVSIAGTSPYYLCQPLYLQANVFTTCNNNCFPRGIVAFFDGNISLGSAVLNNAGVATLIVSDLSVGSHSISATYIGNSSYNSSSSTTTANLSISKASTTLNFNILPNSNIGSIYGQTMIFGAEVTSPIGNPTSGSVSFLDENGIFATVKLDASGKATYSTALMNAGTHTYTAIYNPDCCSNGDGCFDASSATISPYVIQKVLPNVQLTGTPQTVVYGDVISLNATIASYSVGNPKGSVTFYVGSNLLGTVPIVDGMAILRVSNYLSHLNIPTGANVIFKGVYSGDENFIQTNTNNWSETITKAAVTVALYSESPNPSFLGKAVNLTASVRSLLNIPTDAGNTPVGIPPTGTITFVVDGTPRTPVTLTNGIATLSISNLSVGSPHTIIAQYSGDNNFLSDNSITYTQQVQKVGTTTTVTSMPNPSTYNASPSFTVTIASLVSGQGTPTGTIRVTYGENTSQTYTLTSGQVIFSLQNLPTGSNNMTIVYSGDSTFSSSSTVYNQIVTPATTQIISSVTPISPIYGQPITLNAVVSSTQGTPTGTVLFTEGSTTIGVGTLSSGTTSINLKNLTVGNHTIIATYPTQGNFNSSSVTLNFTVNQATTSTSLQTSEENSIYGKTVTFQATVFAQQSEAENPTGTITFYNGSSPIKTAAVDNGGTATISMNSLDVANSPYTISAIYSGDANFSGSTSSPIQQNIIPNSTTINVASSNNPAVIGSSIDLTVNVSAVNTTEVVPNGGIVNIYDGSNPTPIASGNLTNGSVVIPLRFSLATGTYSLTISYSDRVNSNFTSSSTYFNQIIIPGTTTTSLISFPNPSTYGQGVTLTSTVTNTTTSFNGTPSGKVSFIENGAVIGTGVLSSSNPTTAQSSITLFDLSVDLHSITAVYSGDDNLNTSSSTPLSQQVNKASTSTTIILNNPNPSQFGNQVTFVALIATDPLQPANSIVNKPTGTVSFYDEIIDPAYLIGTVPTNGLAMFETTQLAVSSPFSHHIIAVYNGDQNYQSSISAPVSQIVTNTSQTFTTQTTLVSNLNPANYGCPITFNIRVKPILIPDPYPGAPTGTVYLYLGSVLLTPVGVEINPVTGTASFTIPYDSISLLPAGSLQIVAIYSGDDFYSSSTITYNQIVNPIPVNLTLSSSVNPSIVNQSVTFNALLSAIESCSVQKTIIPTGTVSFYDGQTLIGTMQINAEGLSCLTNQDLSIGVHTITAIYNPDPNFQATSAFLQQNVNCIQTQTQMLNAYPNPVIQGDEILFMMGVSALPNQNMSIETSPPIGTVTFYDTFNGVGPNPIGTVTLSNGLAILNISTLDSGTHFITAVYSGSTNFCSSSLPAPGYQQVVLLSILPTNISIISSLNPAEYGQTVIFTANVIDPSHRGVPTGTVIFFDGNEAIGTAVLINGVAELVTSDLSIGKHPMTAIYSGDQNYNTATSSVYEQIILASTAPLPPHDFKGCQVINEYLNFSDRVNILTWEPPQDQKGIVRYEIYRDKNLKKLAGIVKKSCSYRFEDRNRKNHNYKYYIVSVNRDGKQSPKVYTKVVPFHKGQ